jgi:hypothetical protein
VERIHVGGAVENSWILYDHMKCLKDWTTLACYVCNKCCKVLIITCCDMQSKDGTT